jgi:hypothetical protein
VVCPKRRCGRKTTIVNQQPSHCRGLFVFCGRFNPSVAAQTSARTFISEGDIYTTKSLNESSLEMIRSNVRQQLIKSNAVASKAIQENIREDKVIELLDSFLDEFVKDMLANSKEYKSLTGWILYDSVKRRFLKI